MEKIMNASTDGRCLQEDIQKNENVVRLLEAIYAAEQNARESVRLRNEEKESKERALRALARMMRQDNHRRGREDKEDTNIRKKTKIMRDVTTDDEDNGYDTDGEMYGSTDKEQSDEFDKEEEQDPFGLDRWVHDLKNGEKPLDN